jgi:hypothetical protein
MVLNWHRILGLTNESTPKKHQILFRHYFALEALANRISRDLTSNRTTSHEEALYETFLFEGA